MRYEQSTKISQVAEVTPPLAEVRREYGTIYSSFFAYKMLNM